MGDVQPEVALDDLLALLDGAEASQELQQLAELPTDSLVLDVDASDAILSPLGDVTLDFPDASQLLEHSALRDGDWALEDEGWLEASTPPLGTCGRVESGRTRPQLGDAIAAVVFAADGKPKKDPNKARNERAKEIRSLRVEVKELTQQLNTLQGVSGREKCKAIQSREPREFAGVPPLWESICRNQLTRRVRSERENVRLKRALEDQVRLASGLDRAIKRPATALVRECPLACLVAYHQTNLKIISEKCRLRRSLLVQASLHSTVRLQCGPRAVRHASKGGQRFQERDRRDLCDKRHCRSTARTSKWISYARGQARSLRRYVFQQCVAISFDEYGRCRLAILQWRVQASRSAILQNSAGMPSPS